MGGIGISGLGTRRGGGLRSHTQPWQVVVCVDPVSLPKVERTALTLQGIWGLNKGVPSTGRPWRKGLDMRVEAQVPAF